MSGRVVVSVATGQHYLKGQRRLLAKLDELGEESKAWSDCLPPGSPQHRDVPYAFKACAMQHAAGCRYEQILWADASILPLRSLQPIWDRAEEHGVWMLRNGYANATWTCDEAYPHLFPEWFHAETARLIGAEDQLTLARKMNAGIEHVMAGAIAIDLRHEKGRAFLTEYHRLATQTRAFCGPWTNTNSTCEPTRYTVPRSWRGERESPCGPRECRGHRHDQTAASVVAWRLGIPLTDPPELVSYPPADRVPDSRTVAWMCGNYDASVNFPEGWPR